MQRFGKAHGIAPRAEHEKVVAAGEHNIDVRKFLFDDADEVRREEVMHHAREHGEMRDGEAALAAGLQPYAEDHAEVVHVGLAGGKAGDGAEAPLGRDAGLLRQHAEGLGGAEGQRAVVFRHGALFGLPAEKIGLAYARHIACRGRGREGRAVFEAEDIQGRRVGTSRNLRFKAQAKPAEEREALALAGEHGEACFGKSAAHLLDERGADAASGLVAFLALSRAQSAERARAVFGVVCALDADDGRKAFGKKGREGAQFLAFEPVVHLLEHGMEAVHIEVGGFQFLHGEAHANDAVEGFQHIAHGLAGNAVYGFAHGWRIRQEQDEAAARIHDARHGAESTAFEEHQPDGAGEHLQAEGAGAQELACSSVPLLSLPEDEVLYARELAAEEQERRLPQGCSRLPAVVQGLSDGRRGEAVVEERDVGPCIIGRRRDAPGEAFQHGLHRGDVVRHAHVEGERLHGVEKFPVQLGVARGLRLALLHREERRAFRVQRFEHVAARLIVQPMPAQMHLREHRFHAGALVGAAAFAFYAVVAGGEAVAVLNAHFFSAGAVGLMVRRSHAGKRTAKAFQLRRKGQMLFDEPVGVEHMAVRSSAGAVLVREVLTARRFGSLTEFAYVVEERGQNNFLAFEQFHGSS